MKPKAKNMNRILSLMLIGLLAIIPALSDAQNQVAGIVEKRPDPSVKLTRFSETPYAGRRHVRTTDPAISAMAGAIHADTLRATLQELQNWGSRFLMNDNKKEIATSLMNKFLSYGYTDVRLDSFYLIIQNWSGLSDSSWQYNVVCTLSGSSAPEEIYVVGGHWDSICFPDPINDAPGVDDNGTAVAAILEVARIMKLFNYRPETTIRFTLFAAEELGLYGSRFASEKARSSGEDVRYMLNLDMISNNPENLAMVKVYQYLGFEWAGLVAADAIERYTDLSVVFPADNMNSGSDSFPFWLFGFPSAYFEEIAFSPNWHKPSDTLGNCNVPYLAKVTAGALATLAEQQNLPYPQKLRAESTKEEISLQWMPTNNAFVKGYNIYRSETPGTAYQKINPAPLPDSVYHDLSVTPNQSYYYVVTTVNDSLQESAFSNEVSGARFSFSDSLLVLANLKGNNQTPDSIRAFYEAALDTIPYKWYDINATRTIDMAMVSRYRSIFWMSNSTDFESINDNIGQCVLAHMANGGNLLFAGFSPGKFWMSNTIPYPFKVPESFLFYHLFRVDSIDRKIQCMLFRANAVMPGYDTLHIDSLKHTQINFPGQIHNVDVFAPAQEANVIYRFDTYFDSTTSLGKMKHRPVGLEYLGEDHKSILLSFPLYYLDTADAREFMQFIMREKFMHPVGINPLTSSDPFAFHVFPNPVKEVCNVSFTLDKPGRVRLTLVSMSGQTLAVWMDRGLEKGTHWFRYHTASLSPGMYHVLLQGKDGYTVRKIILSH